MTWSLMNHMQADAVTKLLSDARGTHNDDPSFKPAMPKEMAEGIIHAALWSHGSRDGSTASGFAFMNLMQILGIKRWSFKEDWSDGWPAPPKEVVAAPNPPPPPGTP